MSNGNLGTDRSDFLLGARGNFSNPSAILSGFGSKTLVLIKPVMV